MSTILEAVGTYLQTQGQGTLGTNLFLGRMPSSPDVCVGVFEYEGAIPSETFGNAATAIDRPRVQVLVRAGRDDYPTARNQARTIRGILGAVTQTTLSGITVLRIRPTGSVNPLGPDENDRPMISVNFEVMVLP